MTSIPMTNDAVDQWRRLGLRASRESLTAFLELAGRSGFTPAQLLAELATLERRERESLNLKNRVRIAALGDFEQLDQFDWNHPRTIPRELFEQLCTTQFIPPAHNVLLRGQSGVGKTMLAKNLGLLGLQRGYKVLFTTLASLLASLLRQETIPAFERSLRRYTAPHLLIIDELGYLPADARAADMLYQVIAARHKTRSTIITTNLAYKQWTTVFPNAACVGALVDRFVEHCHVIEIDADSWRAKNAEKFKKNRPTPQ